MTTVRQYTEGNTSPTMKISWLTSSTRRAGRTQGRSRRDRSIDASFGVNMLALSSLSRGKNFEIGPGCERVLHIKPVFPPVDTSSTTINSFRADSSTLERCELCGHKTTPQRYFVATYQVCSKHISSGRCNDISSRWIRQARRTHYMKDRKGKKIIYKYKKDTWYY